MAMPMARKRRKTADIDEVNGDEGIGEETVGFDLHPDCGVTTGPSTRAHDPMRQAHATRNQPRRR